MVTIRLNANKTIAFAETKLLIYRCIVGNPKYDVASPDPDIVTELDMANANMMMARSKPDCWKPLFGSSIAAIHRDWDLLAMDDERWEQARDAALNVFRELLLHRGIGTAVLTKGLHRKRPAFIPICDKVVVSAVGVAHLKKEKRIVECMDMLRGIGRQNGNQLRDIIAYGGQRLTPLTSLRALEAIVWIEHNNRYRPLWEALEASGDSQLLRAQVAARPRGATAHGGRAWPRPE